MISIVTISYNQARWLPRMLQSIDANRRGGVEIEHIVVDAGSTDGSLELLDSHRSAIDLLIAEPDSGPADGLNKGFKRATGEMVGYINADDMLLPGAAAAIEAAVRDGDGCDLLIGDGVLVDADDRVIRAVRSARHPSLRGVALGIEIVMQQATFFSKPLLGPTPFNVENRVAWDTQLLLDVLRRNPRIANVDHLLGAFRIHDEGITGSGAFLKRIKQEHKRLMLEYCGESWTWRHDVEATCARLGKALESVADEPSRLVQRLTPGGNRRFR